MPLEPHDAQHLTAAHGYLALDMYEDANDELESITAELRHVPEVLMVRLAIYHRTKRWHAMAAVAAKLVEWSGGEPDLCVDLAYASRRAESLERAQEILSAAAARHPKHGLILFTLACYEAQLGNLDAARSLLQRACQVHARFKALSLDEPDLEPLWKQAES